MVTKKKVLPLIFFSDFIRLLLNKYILLIVGTVGAFVFSCVYTGKIMSKEYTATAVIYIDKNPGPLPAILNEVITSESVLLATLDLLKNDEQLPQEFSVSDIRKTLTVDFEINYSPYVSLSYADVNPVLSIKLINALADTAVEKGNENPSFSPQGLSIDKYAVNSYYNGLSDSLIWALSSFLGFTVAVTLILLNYYIRGNFEFTSTIEEMGLKHFKIKKKVESDNIEYFDMINALETSFTDSPIKVIGVIYLGSESNQSQIIENLSLTYAFNGNKTLILDFNFDSPLNSINFSPNSSPKYLDEYILDTEQPEYVEIGNNIHYVQSRKLKIYGHLFKQDGLAALFNYIRKDFDNIIIRIPGGEKTVAYKTIIPFMDLTILPILIGNTKINLIEKYVYDQLGERKNRLFAVLFPKKSKKIPFFTKKTEKGIE